MEKSGSYVSKTIMNLLVICKLMNMTYGEIPLQESGNILFGKEIYLFCK